VYSVGSNRIWYSSDSAEGKLVEADILTPQLERSDKREMTDFHELYYIDVLFTVRGSHVIRVFEDNVLRHRDILVVDRGNLIIYPEE
jgi:hypothetical protein